MNKEQQQILDIINQYGLTKDSLEEMIERDNQHKKIMLEYYEVESKNRFGHIGNSINNILKTNDKFRETHLNPFTEKQPTKEEGFESTGVVLSPEAVNKLNSDGYIKIHIEELSERDRKFYSTFGRLPNKSERLFITEYGVNAIIDLRYSGMMGCDVGKTAAEALRKYTESIMSLKGNRKQFKHKSKFHD